MNTQQLIYQAISLPIEERALIIESLIQSLNPSEDEIEQAWLDTAQKRLAEIESGQVQPISGEEVFNKIWKRLEK